MRFSVPDHMQSSVGPHATGWSRDPQQEAARYSAQDGSPAMNTRDNYRRTGQLGSTGGLYSASPAASQGYPAGYETAGGHRPDFTSPTASSRVTTPWLARGQQDGPRRYGQQAPPSSPGSGWWNASPTASSGPQWQQKTPQQPSSAMSQGGGGRNLPFASPTNHSSLQTHQSGSFLGSQQQQQQQHPRDQYFDSQGWVPASPARSPLRMPTSAGMSPIHFNVYDMKSLSVALATVQAGTGQVARVFQACSFKPRLPGLTKLVSQLTREGNWQKGLEVYESLGVLGVVPDTTITNAAISACDKGGQWEKALAIFNAMEEGGLPRDAITYSALISALSKGRQWSLAIDVFNHMSDAGIECDAVTCCSLITALDKGGQWQLAEQVFVQMYADHPQFRMLLQCMDQEPSPPPATGGRGVDMLLTHAAWDPAAEGELAATLAAAARLIGAGNQIPGLLGGDAYDSGRGGLNLGVEPGANAPSDTLFRLYRGRLLGGPSPTATPSAGSTVPGTPTANTGTVGTLRHLGLCEDLTSQTPGHQVPSTPPTPSAQVPAPRHPARGGSGSGASLNEDEGGDSAGGAAGKATKPTQEGLAPAGPADVTQLLQFMGSMPGGTPGGVAPPQGSTGVTSTGAPGEVDALLQMMGGLMKPPSQGSVPGTPERSQAGGMATWADLQARLGSVGSTGTGAGDLSQQAPPGLDAMSPGAMNLAMQYLQGSGLSGLTSPPHSQFLSPASGVSPLPRGTPGSHPRALLRTSSLNVKKAAPNRVCCNALLAAYARAVPTQWQRALRLLDLMWQCGGEMQPDIVSYNTVIKAAGNAQQVALGFQVYQLMCSRGIEPTVATYGTLICIAADVGASALVKEAWHWLRASGLEVHVTAANAYLSALIKEGEWSEAQALLHSMLSPTGPCRPNAVTFSVMSAAYLTRGEPGAIKQLYQQMCAVGVQPSPNTLGQLVCVLATKGLWDDAISILAAICRNDSSAGGMRPVPGVFSHVFCALRDAAWVALADGDMGARQMLAGRLNDVRHLLQTHTGLAGSGDVSLYRAMVGACAAVGDAEGCLELVHSMLTNGVPVDEDVAAAVLGALCEQRQWPRVVQLVGLVLQSSRGGGGGATGGLPPRVLLQVLHALESGAAWVQVFHTLKVVCSSGQEQWTELMEAIKAASAADLLLLALLVEKEVTGAWVDALYLFTWQQKLNKSSAFLQSQEAYCLMVEILYTHGGAEGLRQAVLLVKSGHEQGVLHYYSLPKLKSSAAGSPAAPGSCTGGEDQGAAPSGGATPGSEGGGGRRGEASKVKDQSKVSKSHEEEEEAAQKQGERTASLVAQAALDLLGDAEDSAGSGSGQPGVTGSGSGAPGARAASLSRPKLLAEAPAGVEEALSGSAPGAGGAATPELPEGGSWVALPGPTAVQAMVVLLAWASTLADAAREQGVVIDKQCADILILVPFSDMEAAEQLLGFSVSGGSQHAAGDSSRPTLAQFRRIISLVLEGAYLSLLRNPAGQLELTVDQERTFVLRPPGVMYWPDASNPGLVHVNMQSFYQAVAAVTVPPASA